ncbi:MAG TPA: cyclic nucleotide-binding domain-containing protein [Acidimicrobiia bacterium]|jgi:CRP-like cAMP-binding protein
MSMMGNQATTHLEEIDLFRRCTPAQRRRARALGTIVDVGPGTTLVREGDQAAEFFVVLDGEATVSVRSAPVGTVEAGQFFGEIGLLDRAARRASVTAHTPMALLVFNRIEFLALVETAPSVSIQIVRSRAAKRRVEPSALDGTDDAQAPIVTAASAQPEPAVA